MYRNRDIIHRKRNPVYFFTRFTALQVWVMRESAQNAFHCENSHFFAYKRSNNSYIQRKKLEFPTKLRSPLNAQNGKTYNFKMEVLQVSSQSFSHRKKQSFFGDWEALSQKKSFLKSLVLSQNL